MRIVPFSEDYLGEMVGLFIEVYSEPGYLWDRKTAREYLLRDVASSPEYCLVALDKEGNCLGGVFCCLDPYYQGKFLFINSLQVKESHRRQGVGRQLLEAVIEVARKNQLDGVYLLTDARVNFPKEWYERLGFQPTGWSEFEVHLDKIKI